MYFVSVLMNCLFICLSICELDQTDLAVDGPQATVKAITLIEDFTAFDTPLPDLRWRFLRLSIYLFSSLLCNSNKSVWATHSHASTIEAVDHFSLNQCRSEDITLKEDLGTQFMDLVDFGKCSLWLLLLLTAKLLLSISVVSLWVFPTTPRQDSGLIGNQNVRVNDFFVSLWFSDDLVTWAVLKFPLFSQNSVIENSGWLIDGTDLQIWLKG